MKLKKLEAQAAEARRRAQAVCEAVAEALSEIARDARYTPEGRRDAARRLAAEVGPRLNELLQAEREALEAYGDYAERLTLQRPGNEPPNPLAVRPRREQYPDEASYREATREWREGLAEASYLETAIRTALDELRDMPSVVLARRYQEALAEGDAATARAVRTIALQRMAQPLPEDVKPTPADERISPEDWPAYILVERELGPEVKPVPSADPDLWSLFREMAKVEEAHFTDEQREARARVMTGEHRVPPTDLSAYMRASEVGDDLRAAFEAGLEERRQQDGTTSQ